MNKVVLLGRLTRDPEIRYSQGESSTAVARFTLAVNRRFKRQGDAQDADFISCVAFGKTAEFMERYMKQGSQICVSGRIQTGSYEKEGRKVYTTDVVVDEVDFADSKNAGNSDGGYQQGGYQQNSRPAPSQAIGDGFMNIPDGIDEELPFN